MRWIYLFLTLIFAGGIGADLIAPVQGELTEFKKIGNPNAPASVYIFSSFTCPHCSQFHKDVLPVLKKEFVETNRANLIFVETPFDKYALTASLLSRCMAPDKWEEFTALLYKMQFTWKNSPTAKKLLADYAAKMGMSQAEFDSCLANKSLIRKLTQQRDNMVDLYGVRALPSVVFVKEGKSSLFLGTDKELISKLKAQDQ